MTDSTKNAADGAANPVLEYAALVTGRPLQKIIELIACESVECSDAEYLDADLRALWCELPAESRALVLVIAAILADRANYRD